MGCRSVCGSVGVPRASRCRHHRAPPQAACRHTVQRGAVSRRGPSPCRPRRRRRRCRRRLLSTVPVPPPLAGCPSVASRALPVQSPVTVTGPTRPVDFQWDGPVRGRRRVPRHRSCRSGGGGGGGVIGPGCAAAAASRPCAHPTCMPARRVTAVFVQRRSELHVSRRRRRRGPPPRGEPNPQQLPTADKKRCRAPGTEGTERDSSRSGGSESAVAERALRAGAELGPSGDGRTSSAKPRRRRRLARPAPPVHWSVCDVTHDRDVTDGRWQLPHNLFPLVGAARRCWRRRRLRACSARPSIQRSGRRRQTAQPAGALRH